MNHALAANCHHRLARLRLFAAALLIVALLTPGALAQTSDVRWEYAALVSDGVDQMTWISPDGNVSRVTMAATANEIQEMYGAPEDAATRGVIRLMNAVGYGGWELVQATSQEYIFKRRVE